MNLMELAHKLPSVYCKRSSCRESRRSDGFRQLLHSAWSLAYSEMFVVLCCERSLGRFLGCGGGIIYMSLVRAMLVL